MNIRTRTLFLLLASAWLTATAQQAVNMKFGKPTKEELEMTTYESDPNAEAVVLCRLTDVNYTIEQMGYVLDYYEKIRIKVLKPEGARVATMTIPYYKVDDERNRIKVAKFSVKTGDVKDEFTDMGSNIENALSSFSDESVEDLKVVAYNLVGNKTVKSTLNKRDAVKEHLDDQHYQLRFTVPDVKEGTVIECEYSIHSELFNMVHDWYAQSDIPVAYARLKINVPGYLIYNMEEHGIQRLNCQCVTGTMVYKLESDPLAAPVHLKTNNYTCIGQNLKAMPKDKYVWNEHDYYAGISMELKGFSLPRTMYMDYTKTWEQVDQMIMDDDDLGKRLNQRSPLQKELEEAKIADIASLNERAAAVFRLVTSRVKWNGQYNMWPRKSSETLQEGSGSNADINLLLIQSCKSVGLEAVPVVLRTRDQGLLPYNFPSFMKLTTFVVGIIGDNNNYVYVDASSAGGYLNVLPPPLLVERARLVTKQKREKWVNLQKLSKAKTTTVIEATLSADGSVKGTQTVLYEGIDALQHRQGKSTDFTPSVKEDSTFNYQGEVNNGQISFCPFPVPPIKENPFTEEERLMPVEFPYLTTQTTTVNVTLTEGYTLAEKPERLVMSTPDKSVEARLITNVSEGKLQIHYQFNVNKITHDSKSYPALRQMFESFAGFVNNKLVVKRAE